MMIICPVCDRIFCESTGKWVAVVTTTPKGQYQLCHDCHERGVMLTRNFKTTIATRASETVS
jgi:hypothetical protein